MPGGHPTGLQQQEIARRRERVLALRSAGMSFGQIAKAMPEVPTARAAARELALALAQARELNEVEEPNRLTLKMERLNEMERTVSEVMTRAAADGDGAMVLQAADRLIRISRRRQALTDRVKPAEVKDPVGQIRERVRKLGVVGGGEARRIR